MNLGSHDPEREKVFNRRAFLFSGGLVALFGGVTYRLAQLQLADHERYTELARENQFNRRVLTPLRGEIVDRFGEVIASNRKNFRVLLIPEETRNVSDTLDAMSQLVDIPPEKRARILRQIQRMGRFTPVEIADNLDWDTFSKINFQVPHLPGIIPEEGRTRDYPLGNGSAFVIGYVGSPNERDLQDPELAPKDRTLLRQPGFKVGREGLEKRYDDELRGKAGEKLVKVNAHGRVIAEIDEQSLCDVEVVRIMSPKVFWPRPKVDSAIIYIEHRPEKRAAIPDLEFFLTFVRSMFFHRRKFMRSVAVAAFKGQLDKPQVDEVLSAEGFGADARSEQLSVEQMQSLCEAFRMKLQEVNGE